MLDSKVWNVKWQFNGYDYVKLCCSIATRVVDNKICPEFARNSTWARSIRLANLAQHVMGRINCRIQIWSAEFPFSKHRIPFSEHKILMLLFKAPFRNFCVQNLYFLSSEFWISECRISFFSSAEFPFSRCHYCVYINLNQNKCYFLY